MLGRGTGRHRGRCPADGPPGGAAPLPPHSPALLGHPGRVPPGGPGRGAAPGAGRSGGAERGRPAGPGAAGGGTGTRKRPGDGEAGSAAPPRPAQTRLGPGPAQPRLGLTRARFNRARLSRSRCAAAVLNGQRPRGRALPVLPVPPSAHSSQCPKPCPVLPVPPVLPTPPCALHRSRVPSVPSAPGGTRRGRCGTDQAQHIHRYIYISYIHPQVHV